MEYNQKSKQNITYLIIGVLTLILTVSGATFAYFTATDDNTDAITGDMATISFDVNVTKVTAVDNTSGLIPMSNSMVEAALTKNAGTGKPGICVDDNNNAVCQVYKITTTNKSQAGMFIDGYVTLTGGSGEPTDYPDSYYTTSDGKTIVNTTVVKNKTTMRWAQAFCEETSGIVTSCTTAGITTTGAESKLATGTDDPGLKSTWGKIENTATTEEDGTYGKTGFNKRQILTTGITTTGEISKSDYEVINTNFIRVSNHDAAQGYKRDQDVTSALVFNEFLSAVDANENPTAGSSANYTDSQVFYIVVWLSETGTNQTLTEEEDRINFFTGTVKFISAQGSEVSSTFTDYSRVSKTD